MTRDEVTKILSVLKVSYPNFYKNITKQDAFETINVYCEMFKDDNANLVNLAVKELINSFQYPPTVADIKNKMYQLTSEEKTPAELWDELAKALRDSIYHSEQQFAKLSPEVKAFVRTPAQLKEMAMMDSDTVHSVTKGQFLKQIETIKKRNKEDKLMLEETKKLKLNLGLIGKDINKLLN